MPPIQQKRLQLKQQHEEIKKSLELLGAFLAPPADIIKKTDQFTPLIARLHSELVKHLQFEDHILYPILLKSDKKHARCSAKKFMREIGDINALFETYVAQWETKTSIENETEKFITETKQLIEQISLRIDKEENELFPAYFLP